MASLTRQSSDAASGRCCRRVCSALGFAGAAYLLTTTTTADAQVPVSDSLKSIMRTATIAFYGEVLRQGSSVPSVRSTQRTWIVRIVAPIRLPLALLKRTTDTITVAIKTTPPAQGSHAIFYAHGWVVGRGYAVIEDARFSIDPGSIDAGLAVWRARTDTAVASLADDRLRVELSRASAVVVARVEALVVRSRDSVRRLRDEHHPVWRDARLRVQSLLKATDATSMEVLAAIIPGSRDIAWQDIPLVKTGDTHLFVLVNPNVYHGYLPGLRPTDRYAVTRALHVLPLTDSTRVRRLLSPTQ